MRYDPCSEGIRDTPDTVVFNAAGEGQIEDTSYASLLYSRGYYLTAGTAPKIGKHWRSSTIGGHTLAWDSRNRVSITAAGGYQVAVLGRCIDLSASTGEAEPIGLRILSAFLESDKELGAALIDLSGRYVVILSAPYGLYLETDATGMKAAYYASSGGVVASHASLAASLAGTEAPSRFGDTGWFGRSGAFSYPGQCTEYAEINSLTPNTRLSVRDGGIRRVHPMAPGEQLAAADAARSILPLMQQQMAWLSAEGMPLVSLTAGLDSRVTLAACRPYRDRCAFFSYTTSRGSSVESTRGGPVICFATGRQRRAAAYAGESTGRYSFRISQSHVQEQQTGSRPRHCFRLSWPAPPLMSCISVRIFMRLGGLFIAKGHGVNFRR